MKYSATTTRKFVEVNGQKYMVEQLAWEMNDGSYDYNYHVYEPIPSYFGDHRSMTSTDDGQKWGEVKSKMIEADFAHLKPGSKERSAVVRAYFNTLEAIARHIAIIAFPELAQADKIALY